MTSRSKLVDISYHFTHEFIKDGAIYIVYAETNDSTTDLCTRNISDDVYNAHANELVEDTKNFEPG